MSLCILYTTHCKVESSAFDLVDMVLAMNSIRRSVVVRVSIYCEVGNRGLKCCSTEFQVSKICHNYCNGTSTLFFRVDDRLDFYIL